MTAKTNFRNLGGVIDVVCGVVRDDQGKFLACLRPPGKHLAGLWEFPGGKIDSGESPHVALARELLEELAIHVEVGEPLAQVVWSYQETSIRLFPFYCKIISGEPQPIEHERIMWCDLEGLRNLEWAAADIPILQELSISAEN